MKKEEAKKIVELDDESLKKVVGGLDIVNPFATELSNEKKISERNCSDFAVDSLRSQKRR